MSEQSINWKFPGKVLFVDNDYKDVKDIIDRFTQEGIAVQYWNSVGENNTNFDNIRIIVLDLNLTDGQGEDKTELSYYQPAAEVLTKIRGPYLIVILSTDYEDGDIDNLKKAYTEFYPEYPPLQTLGEEVGITKEVDFANFYEKIKNKFEEKNVFKLIIAWEKLLDIAKDKTLHAISKEEFENEINVFIKSIKVDSDKSLSIRSFLIGSICEDISVAKNVLESEISLNSPSQIVTLNVVGSVGNMSYGSFVSGVDSSEYLPFIKLGSPYRFELKDTNDSIYKIDSIKENSPNEYLVAASKFDTGKFNLIEQNISIETKENTYDYNVATQLGDKTYKVLNSPQNLVLSTGDSSDFTAASTFFISGNWDDVTSATAYKATLHTPNFKSITTGIINSSVRFDNLTSVGGYAVSVKALGDSLSSNVFIDSEESTKRVFALYEDLEEFDRPFINSITFE